MCHGRAIFYLEMPNPQRQPRPKEGPKQRLGAQGCSAKSGKAQAGGDIVVASSYATVCA